MKRVFLLPIISLALFFCVAGSALSQGSAGSKTFYESRYIVDMPTAGVIPKSTYSAYGQAFSNGGIYLGISASPFRNFNLGISYSGTGIIGDQDVEWQNLPGFQISYRIFDETAGMPAILLGVNTQGRGWYSISAKRFSTMSPGAYISVSRNYKWPLGTIALHGGITYSFEPPSGKRGINIYGGIEQSLGSNASLNLEVNPNLDDDNGQFMKTKGMLNASLRWSVSKGTTIELQVRDMLGNIANGNGFIRTFGLEVIQPF